MTPKVIEALLAKETGMNIGTVGVQALERAIRARMRECELANVEDYYLFLRDSRAEFQELLEEVLVPESWFFRDVEPFRFLREQAQTALSALKPPRRLRVLSAPCAAGEEPYSIAMTLLDAGFTADQMRVEAMDLSKRALERAGRGVYGVHSFRGDDLSFRDRYFESIGGKYLLSLDVRQLVTFVHGDVMAHAFQTTYDIVFCRNLFIYLAPATRERLVSALDRLVAKDGLLFLGHADTFPVGPRTPFVIRKAAAFAYERPRLSAPTTRPAEKPVAAPAAVPQARAPASVEAPPIPEPAAVDPETVSLQAVQRLADAGKLNEAIAKCEDHLFEFGPSANAYYLMGLIHAALGWEGLAEDSFHKALYLQSDHYESLTHLALLLEKRRDAAGAANFRRRADRALESRRKGKPA